MGMSNSSFSCHLCPGRAFGSWTAAREHTRAKHSIAFDSLNEFLDYHLEHNMYAAPAAPTVSSHPGEQPADEDSEEEVLVVGERTLEERNAAGFANAIDLDLFADVVDVDEEDEEAMAVEAAAATGATTGVVEQGHAIVIDDEQMEVAADGGDMEEGEILEEEASVATAATTTAPIAAPIAAPMAPPRPLKPRSAPLHHEDARRQVVPMRRVLVGAFDAGAAKVSFNGCEISFSLPDLTVCRLGLSTIDRFEVDKVAAIDRHLGICLPLGLALECHLIVH